MWNINQLTLPQCRQRTHAYLSTEFIAREVNAPYYTCTANVISGGTKQNIYIYIYLTYIYTVKPLKMGGGELAQLVKAWGK